MIADQLRLFFDESKEYRYSHSKWIRDRQMEVYVRHSFRFIDNVKMDCLDIANISVFKPGKGTFTKFLIEAVKINPYPVTYIENVLSERFREFFRKRRWIEDSSGFPPSFYLLKKE